MPYFAGGQHAFQPYVLYRSYQGYDPQFEAGTVFHINHILWAGGAYRDEFGYFGLVGLKIQDYLTIGYAYDMSSQSISGVNLSTHEIQLTFTTGLKSEWTEQYSRFHAGQQPERPKRFEPATEEHNPRFKRAQRYRD